MTEQAMNAAIQAANAGTAEAMAQVAQHVETIAAQAAAQEVLIEQGAQAATIELAEAANVGFAGALRGTTGTSRFNYDHFHSQAKISSKQMLPPGARQVILDESFCLAVTDSEKAYEEMDYLKCYETLGALLHLVSDRGWVFSRKDGSLPHYVPLNVLLPMISEVTTATKKLHELCKKDFVQRDPELHSELHDIHYALRRVLRNEYRNLAQDGSPLSEEERLAHISENSEYHYIGDAIDTVEEMTDLQRLVEDIERTYRNHDDGGLASEPEDHVPPPAPITGFTANRVVARQLNPVGEVALNRQVLMANNEWRTVETTEVAFEEEGQVTQPPEDPGF